MDRGTYVSMGCLCVCLWIISVIALVECGCVCLTTFYSAGHGSQEQHDGSKPRYQRRIASTLSFSKEGAHEGPKDEDRDGGAGGTALVGAAGRGGAGEEREHHEGVDRP